MTVALIKYYVEYVSLCKMSSVYNFMWVSLLVIFYFFFFLPSQFPPVKVFVWREIG